MGLSTNNKKRPLPVKKEDADPQHLPAKKEVIGGEDNDERSDDA
jgi:hypothetical protein